jgi:geranylgeranyl diphosphate synthase type II
MVNQDFVSVLKKYQELLWPIIEKIIRDYNKYPKYCQLDDEYKKEQDFHLKIVSDYPRRKGKYLRPSLLLLTAQSMGVQLNKALNTAAAMQMSEDWILGHDDIEDNSPDRRGQPALHKIYGNELAINAGDALHMIMWRTLFDNFGGLNKSLAMKIIEEFYVMMSRTVLGQEIELRWAKDNRFDLSDKDNFLVLESKTGYYTIAGPMRLGAIIAGATKKQLGTIYRFGVLLGRSFQIVDDLLDLTSDYGGLKKIKGNDILENKRTLMLLHLYRKVNRQDREKLIRILNKKRENKTEIDVVKVIGLMEKYGSLNYGRKKAKEFAVMAKTIFRNEMGFIRKQPYRGQIMAGIDFIVSRDH